MLGGVVSDLVDKVVVTDVGGSDVPLEIRNGTFFFDGGQGRSVVAYDGAGQIVGSYDLQGAGG